MPSCALRYCKSSYGRPSGRDYSLFSFPSVQDEVREEWIEFVQKERSEQFWLPSSCSRLCSKHFRTKDIYFGKTGRAILKKNSVPVAISEYNDNETNNQDGGRVTPIDVDVSDSESIFDTPKKIVLKAQVKKLEDLKLYHQAKIKQLSQENRYLKRKILKLKNKPRKKEVRCTKKPDECLISGTL